MTDDRQAALVRITGRVQGVGFRLWARDQAKRLGLTGWVRNEADGSVKALIAGETQAVSAMLCEFRKGPHGAAVLDVEVAPVTIDETLREFSIRAG
jgi:acylphosphatase